ncbi:Ferric reductase transmembrane component [Wickerhamomyces ciferrii]|uniref:ferric-chelate reductase (NADPH) n=1 Tax=Wickerhamomyces ciferrii (strain ATCC 14091 / BCRC 22168 / CBS 111 / JCM 3599 / NBRC 0793 / NRRL Y-1031 F-60-10) TaxID=1206466 RepID=K0KIT8_WICCF|nr:Ferric reductase transmembrane component [Wickerhamomyces ciferrii]CCH41324.1 Ferric reductase transmembrane component [Wickerhamomyces ciferrii]
MKFFRFIIACILLIQVSAKPATKKPYGPPYKWMQKACGVMIGPVKYDYEDPDLESEDEDIASAATKKQLCTFEPMLGSMVLCMSDGLGGKNKAFNSSLELLAKSCKKPTKGKITLEYLLDVYQNATEYSVDPPITKKGIIDKKAIKKITYFQPVKMPEYTMFETLRYYKNLYFNQDKGSIIGGMNYVFFLIVFLVYGVSNFIKRLGFQRRFNNKYINWYRSNIEIPALFNGKHTEAPSFLKVFSAIIPSRMESVVILLFVSFNILISTFHYNFDYSPRTWAYMFTQLVSDRTGIIAFSMIPLLIIFAGRNNLLTSLTGIPFKAFIHYHKWVARLMWINAFIHSITYIYRSIMFNEISTYFLQIYIQWGTVGIVASFVILLQAYHFFRTMSYEVFLVTHIVLAIVFVIACFYHCYDIGYLEWIYVSWAIWGADRVQRIIRMCMFGFRDAEIEFISDDTFKVTVKHNKLFKPFPGSFAYIYFITPTMFWQSHPFTIIDEASNENECTAYIKAKAGITNRLKKHLGQVPGNKKTIKISIEGPYGHRAPAEKYDTALLLAGGNGIPGPYYYAVDLAKRASATRQQIKLLWTFRNPEALFWFQKELKFLAHLTVQTDIYITGEIPKIESSSSDSDKEKKDVTTTGVSGDSSDTDSSRPSSITDLIESLSGHINFHYGRPDVEKIIIENFTDESGPSVAVISCGPPKMVDNVRAFTAKHLQSAKGRIDLFEELQVW